MGWDGDKYLPGYLGIPFPNVRHYIYTSQHQDKDFLTKKTKSNENHLYSIYVSLNPYP
jgi:hypothetical protein